MQPFDMSQEVGFRSAMAAILLILACVSGVICDEQPALPGADADHLNDAILNTISRVFQDSSHFFKAVAERPSTEGAVVSTTSGEVTGALFSDSTVFYGIPYGEKPVRFMESQLRAAREPIDASKVSKVTCFQSCLLECSYVGDPIQREDCLNLNVYVPHQIVEGEEKDLLPVLFWIHGGAFFGGSGTNSWYDGHWLSKATNTIVVTINYRLGALGFLTYAGTELSGNQGIGDQQLALQWVHQNIKKFGGDRNQVTIFGESAGGQSVMLHLASKKSAPYFKRAIMQSNPAAARYRNKEETQDNTDWLLELTKCDSLKCLQDTPVENIIKQHTAIVFKHLLKPFTNEITEFKTFIEVGLNVIEPFRPVIGGNDFPEQPMTMFHKGEWNTDKEVIIGHNEDEMSVFLEVFLVEIGKYIKDVTAFLEPLWKKIKELFGNIPGVPYLNSSQLPTQIKENLERILTTYAFSCPSRTLARYLQTTGQRKSNIYFYNFKYGPDAKFIKAINLPKVLAGKAFHGSEILFLFGNEPRGFSNDDKIMRDMLSNYWGNFSYTGMPSADNMQWPPYTNIFQYWPLAELNVPESSVASDYTYFICEFFKKIGVYKNIDPPLPNEANDENSKDEL